MNKQTCCSELSFTDIELRLAAEQFASGPAMWAAIQKATSSHDAFTSVQKNPEAFFAEHGAKLPEGLMVEVFAHQPRQLPAPDWTPFVLELTNCRTVWGRECDDSNFDNKPPRCEYKEETVCFGIRIRPRFPRVGPFPPI